MASLFSILLQGRSDLDFLIYTFAKALKILLVLPSDISGIILLTLELSLLATFFSCLLGFPLAFYLYISTSRFKGVLVTLVNSGLAAPPVVVGLLVFLFLSRQGPLGELNLLYTPAAIVIAETLLGIPVVASLGYAALLSIPAEKLFQLLGWGATFKQALLKLAVEARSGLFAAVMAAFGAIISEVGAVLMVGGNIPEQTRVLTTAIVVETRMGRFERALALATILFVLTVVFNYFFTRAQSSRGDATWKQHIWR